MKRLPIYALGVVTLLVACGGSTAEELTAAQIDAYVGEMSGYTYGTVEHRSTGEQIEAGLEMCDDFREDAVLHMGTIEIAEAGRSRLGQRGNVESADSHGTTNLYVSRGWCRCF